VRTLGCLFSLLEFLANSVYKRWLGASMIFLPSSEVAYGIYQMIDYRGSWINNMS